MFTQSVGAVLQLNSAMGPPTLSVTMFHLHCPGHAAICRLLSACTILGMLASADFSVHVLSWNCRHLQTSQWMYFPGHAAISRLLGACPVLDILPFADFSVHVLSCPCRHLQTFRCMYCPGHAGVSRLPASADFLNFVVLF